MVINTLVTIKDSITAFADGHGQLQGRVIFEADDHRSAYITEENTYPLLFVAPIDVAVNRAMNVHTLRVYVYERINDDRLDVWENANDTSLILRDIRVWWNDYGVDDINIVEDPIGQFGCDKELDNLVGYFADIRFEIPSHGRCQVPVDVEPLPPPPSFADATSITTDSDGNELYSNSIPSGATETQVIQDSTAVLKDTLGTFISSTYILAEGSEDITAPDAKLHIKKENDGTITNLNLLSNSATDYIIDNNDISVNGVLEFDIHATEALDIRLRDASNNVITPISVTDSGNHATIVLPNTAAPIGATLMKTGQTVQYRSGDDGDIEAGRATSFLQLASANPFGNTKRFTDELGGETYTNNWVIDWSTYNGSTVLGYYRVVQGNPSNWNTAIDNSLSGTFGTFSGCRLPNIHELFNIKLKGLEVIGKNFNYSPFNISSPDWIWSSTVGDSTAQRMASSTSSCGLAVAVTSNLNTYGFIPVRTFTVTGTTLT